ncbi:hypothetical protein [Patiriisocius marinus]|uniref:hypothetical protein n=1 Tax=Patiriisocius marinus TaxID=1397112 RepID=UPI00232FEC56|nr:hypothetical protein [Patiriisocius marinus]
MIKYFSLLIVFFLFVNTNAQVGIGTVSPEAVLDITSEDSGLLIPRVSLTNLATESPVLNPQTGNIPISTLVFHDGTNSIATGFYYWGGTQWVRLSTSISSGDKWDLLGNVGTVASTNFIGTTDAVDLVLRTDNTERVRVDAAGNVGVGGSNAFTKLFVAQTGTGNGQLIEVANTSNNAAGQIIFHDGDGFGQYIGMSNPTASSFSAGLVINYNGTVNAGGGGGNALDVQHYGNNGYAAEIFQGNPSILPGPANTTSEFAGLSIGQYATGNSPTAGLVKAAIVGTNYSNDPVALFQNLSTDGPGVEVYTSPSIAAGALTTAIYARADNVPTNGFGVAIWGDAGNYGVIGGTSTNGASSNFGLLSLTNSGAFGVKSFIIDHPTDPVNKTLRHYSIESNEVLNIYRGTVKTGVSGIVKISLPDYFAAANAEPSYQLTPIGSGVTPYISKEINNNEFEITGAPNTKISWAVFAKRDDPTLRYFDSLDNFSENEKLKPSSQRGKYFTPQAYGKSKEEGVFYNAGREKNYEERFSIAKSQKAATLPQSSVNAVENAPQPSASKIFSAPRTDSKKGDSIKSILDAEEHEN